MVNPNNGLLFATGVNVVTLTSALGGTGSIALQTTQGAAYPVAITLAGGNAASTIYGGVLSGSGSLNIAGGSLTLINTDTYTGGTTIGPAGTLWLGAQGGGEPRRGPGQYHRQRHPGPQRLRHLCQQHRRQRLGHLCRRPRE